ncbi:MAG: FAD-dependent oxidoreductase [Candidatus Omnitrophica bacterium]|nr:FAD-dependent oxidoreductase [Candidatus Omnitrophota bacterium]
MRDLIIIGAGPAGITAGIYAIRQGLDLLVISKDIGGQTVWSGDIENYTGYQFISGPELTGKFEEHMRKYGIELKNEEEVTKLEKTGGGVTIETVEGQYESRTAIIASGKRSKELNVPGEKEFKNRGLTYCATCDGPLFAKKDVAIIGGGNSAMDAALKLIKIANRIYIINNTPALGGDAIIRQKVIESDKVSTFNSSRVASVFGDKLVSGIKIVSGKNEKTFSVQGVFVEIGLVPNSGFIKGVDKNEDGEIKVNKRNETNIPGIFAAGDVTDVPEKQIIVATGEGAKAALQAFKYLAQQK